MLENERYNSVIRHLHTNSLQFPHADSEEIMSIMLEEEYKTQQALKKLGVDATSDPSEVPGINTVKPNRNISTRKLPLIVELWGMPNAGKTILGKEFSFDYGLYFIGEMYQVAKSRAPNNKYREQMVDFLTKSISSTKALILMQLMQERIIEFAPIISDKWETGHLIFTRTKLLKGGFATDLEGRNRDIGIKHRLESLTDPREFNYAIINCLVTPATSLDMSRRQDEDLSKPHTILTPEFLRVLYEQHLRAHSEMVNYETLHGKDLPVTYASVDLNSNDFSGNKARFRNIMHEVLSIYRQTNQSRAWSVVEQVPHKHELTTR